MWIFGNENWQDTTNHPEYGTEQNNGQNWSSHDSRSILSSHWNITNRLVKRYPEPIFWCGFWDQLFSRGFFATLKAEFVWQYDLSIPFYNEKEDIYFKYYKCRNTSCSLNSEDENIDHMSSDTTNLLRIVCYATTIDLVLITLCFGFFIQLLYDNVFRSIVQKCYFDLRTKYI